MFEVSRGVFEVGIGVLDVGAVDNGLGGVCGFAGTGIGAGTGLLIAPGGNMSAAEGPLGGVDVGAGTGTGAPETTGWGGVIELGGGGPGTDEGEVPGIVTAD